MTQNVAGLHGLLARFAGAVAAAVILAAAPLAAQDVTLTSRDGALSVSGNLISYDGEFFRVVSDVGPLTITADSVVCDGPACPDLTAPKALIRMTGDAEAGLALLPKLIAAFATAKGFDLRKPGAETAPTLLLQPGTSNVLAEFSFTPRAPEAARSAMADAMADLVVARFAPLDSAARILALDALVPIVSPQNTAHRLSTADLAAAMAGKIENWNQVGGPDMPLVLHGLDSDSDLSAALAARLDDVATPAKVHNSLAALAAAVAADPWALAMTGRSNAGPARIVPLVDSCGFVLDPSPISVKTDDYPLTLPVYLLTPQRRLPLIAREFLDFLAHPAAQAAIGAAGFVTREIELRPLAQDGARLINAVKSAQDGAALPLLQRLAMAMETDSRASFSFRFENGTMDLDLTSTETLSDLALHIAAGQMQGVGMALVGFVPAMQDRGAEEAESLLLAEAVLTQLQLLVPDLPAASWPSIDAFGAAMPLACDTTSAGKRLNRRVELWLRPG